MNIGASTSCFYPLETEKALNEVIKLGFKKSEIFFNTSSELEPSFVKELRKTADENGVKILSIHPFSSAIENTCIFGEYPRRFEDFIGLYRAHCHAAAILGAGPVVIHGALKQRKIPLDDDFYFERFRTLVEIGKSEGVTVCQENVKRFKSEDIEFMKKMRSALGSDFHMVFDIKQAIRAGYDPFDFLEEMKNEIVHVHLSDNNLPESDCLPPGRGSFDFSRLFNILKAADYKGDYVIEIYSKGLDVKKELAFSKNYFENLNI
ncbi:MAG: sugar phosphate isomerase/epimerase [Eubacterium sp.]|nr:sugar phosphate isomerase/epimerase [Eubacterium sp.]MBR7072120.1 sugar phosphate isomerase/epimerase [Eubacterium sp.]